MRVEVTYSFFIMERGSHKGISSKSDCVSGSDVGVGMVSYGRRGGHLTAQITYKNS